MRKKGLTDEQWNNIENIIKRDIEERKKEPNLLESLLIIQFQEEVKSNGFKFNNYIQLKSICLNNQEKLKNIISTYYKHAVYNTEKEFLLGCMNHKDLVPFFIEELYNTDSHLIKVALGNCLMRTADKRYIDEYIKLLNENNIFCDSDSSYIGECLRVTADINYKHEYLEMLNKDKLGWKRLYIIQIVGKLKIKEAIPKLIKLLDDEDLREFVLEGLNYYKNPDLLPYFEKYKNDNNDYIKRAAKKGIASIEKILNKN